MKRTPAKRTPRLFLLQSKISVDIMEDSVDTGATDNFVRNQCNVGLGVWSRFFKIIEGSNPTSLSQREHNPCFSPLVILLRLSTGPLTGGYDADFKEPALVDLDADGLSERIRQKYPPISITCQVETESYKDLRMFASGNAPQTEIGPFYRKSRLGRCLSGGRLRHGRLRRGVGEDEFSLNSVILAFYHRLSLLVILRVLF